MAFSFSEIKSSVATYGTHAPALFFFAGALWDSVTLWKPDGVFENITFAAYLLVTTLIIFVIPLFQKKNDERVGIMIAVLQFCFGNLAGGLMILYMRSGTLAGSATFLVLLVGLIVANEFLKARYRAHALRMGVWYALLVLYVSMALPIVYQRIGEEVFMHGLVTAFSLAFALLVLQRALKLISRPQDWLVSLGVISVVTVFFFGTHLARMMPPVPLALRTAGIAHSAVHVGDTYELKYEASQIPFIVETSSTFHATLPARVYCFSEVYAPKGLTTNLQHHWQVYDTDTSEWSDIVTVPYSILGGREDGYRGYSYIALRAYGTYRCTIETEKGVIVGRRTFTAEAGQATLVEDKL